MNAMFRSLARAFATAGVIAGFIAASPEAQAERRLELRLHRVTCVKETSSGPLIGTHGKDHMVLTGVALPLRGAATRIPTIELGQFDTGDSFPVPRLFAQLPVVPGVPPAEYGVVLVLAETDIGGGLGTYATKLVDELNEARRKASEAALKNLPPGTTAAVHPLVVAVAKEIAEKLAEEGIKRAREAAKDDIFPDELQTVKVSGPEPRLDGGTDHSGKRTVRFKGHGGEYIVTYSWRLVG